ncbi:MAG: hypothetical protein HC936_08860, partial [Leptolyngbyaceae cyanobacterium SU_3_3]|nr:hypothetical protein [Leptolyngbyaceae cyanobacterium SU_3_3]
DLPAGAERLADARAALASGQRLLRRDGAAGHRVGAWSDLRRHRHALADAAVWQSRSGQVGQRDRSAYLQNRYTP